MWHVFENKQSIDAGVDEEERIIPILKRYLNDYGTKEELINSL